MSLRSVAPLAVLVGFIVPSIASAQRAKLDPELKTPYLWRIVIKVKPHPLLSFTFREQLKRDIEAALQPELGALGAVEVIDLASTPRETWDPFWQQFDDKGFAALDAVRDLNVVKTHFLKVEYRDGLYHLEARQHDGFTGLASGYAGFGTPVIRKESVRAPEMVGRTAGLLLDRDFGLDGTIEPILANPREVIVAIRGGGLGPIASFVKKGDVFAVADVVETRRPAPPVMRTATGKVIAPPPGSIPPRGLTSRLRGFSLLKVSELKSDGTLLCEALYRPFQANPGLAGYRCMKLGTIEAPLAVRVLSNSQTAGLSVRATEKGFDAKEDDRDRLLFQNGLYHSTRPLSNVACVTVATGTQKKLFPVAVLGADPVPLSFDVNENQAEFDRVAAAAINHVVNARNAQTVCFEALTRLIDKQKNTEALIRGRQGRDAAKQAAQSIKDELEQLKDSSGKTKTGADAINYVQRNLVALEKVNTQLESTIKTLEGVVARENDPSLKGREIEAKNTEDRIQVLLARGDVEEAISAYDKLALLAPDDPNVKAAREKLKADWATKGPEHVKAREYLLKVWPALTTIPEFKNSLEELARNIDICKKNGDKYALRKLLAVFTGAAVKLNELVAALDSSADKKLINEAKSAGEFLAQREIEIQEFVK